MFPLLLKLLIEGDVEDWQQGTLTREDRPPGLRRASKRGIKLRSLFPVIMRVSHLIAKQ